MRNPQSSCEQGFEVLPATNKIVSQFGGLLTQISQAALDQSITPDVAESIRQQWDKLKCYGEGFVRCCEEGDFEKMIKEKKRRRRRISHERLFIKSHSRLPVRKRQFIAHRDVS